MNKVLDQFKLGKAQMNKLGGGYSAVCDLVDENGTHYPSEIRFTTIADKDRLCEVVAQTNPGYKVIDCVYN